MSARPTVVVTRRLPEPVERELGKDFDATLNTDDRPLGPEGLRRALQSADALLCTVTDRLSDEVLSATPRRARLLANFGVGFNHIDVEAAKKHGLAVSNTPDVLTDATGHLVGGLLSEPEDVSFEAQVVGSLRAVLDAAEEAGVARVLSLSYPGADPDTGNAFLRAKGRAEAAILASGLEHAVIRSTLVYGPGSPWLRTMADGARRWPPSVPGSGRQVLAPVFVDDVAAVLAAADDRAGEVRGVWGLEGPDRIEADALADLLAGRPRRPKLHLSLGVARLLRRDLSPAALEVLAADSLADRPDAAREFGLDRTRLTEGLARSTAGPGGVEG